MLIKKKALRNHAIHTHTRVFCAQKNIIFLYFTLAKGIIFMIKLHALLYHYHHLIYVAACAGAFFLDLLSLPPPCPVCMSAFDPFTPSFEALDFSTAAFGCCAPRL